MRTAARVAILSMLAAVAGLGSGELIIRSPACRDVLGRFFQRGNLLALAGGAGIYESDISSSDPAALRSAIIGANLRYVARAEWIDPGRVEEECKILRAQFNDEALFIRALKASGLSPDEFVTLVANQLRELQWLEKQLPLSEPIDAMCEAYFQTHRDEFILPARLRARHLFLTAPDGTASEIVESKARLIDCLWNELERGADFAQLAAQSSEDEATKNRGGDLGFFSSARMPSEFIEKLANLRTGGRTRPFRSHLGFHIVELTNVSAPREIGFKEARREIAAEVTNAARAIEASRVSENLSGVQFRRIGL